MIKYATRERPTVFFQTLALLREYAGRPVHFLVSIDRDDVVMNLRKNTRRIIEMDDVTLCVGSSRSKVQAINADISEFTRPWDVVLVASDDHIPVYHGYADRILSDMKHRFMDTDGSLWYTDPRQDRINFVPVYGRKYWERTRTIYNTEYKSLWCDNEQTEVGLKLGKLAKIDEQLFSNESPDWGGKLKRDRLYQRNNRAYEEDRKVYERRKALGFP